MSKNNLSKGVRNEFDDIDYWHKLPKNQFVTLKDGTRISVYEYMKKFMHESYGNNFSRSEPDSNILQSEVDKKWARRNNNNTNRDALLVSKKMGALNQLFDNQEDNNDEVVGSWEWTFKRDSYHEALNVLIKEICDSFKISFTKENIKLIINIYVKLNKFVRMIKKDKKNKGK